MELSGRPLLDAAPDANLFVGRQGLLQAVEQSVERGFNVLVVGDRGMGKTSLLRHALYQLRSSGSPAVFIEGTWAKDVENLLQLISWRLGMLRKPVVESLQKHPFFHVGAPGEMGMVVDLLHELSSQLSESKRTVVLVDELSPSDMGQILFGRLRDELWQLPLRWVVAIDERDRGKYLLPPADAFFDKVVELSKLTTEEALDLLKKRIPTERRDERILREIAHLGHGNPRRLLAVAREAYANENGVSLSKFWSERDELLSRLGPAAHDLVKELEASGGASASDVDLLNRLGWSRARVVQVLKELEEAGLVEADEIIEGPGRPKKVYRVIQHPKAS